MKLAKEWTHELVCDGQDPEQPLSNTPPPGTIVHHKYDINTFGVVIATHEISQVSVLWSYEPCDELYDYDYGDYWSADNYCDDSGSPTIVSSKDIKEIWLEDSKHERRDNKRVYESEKRRLRHSRH